MLHDIFEMYRNGEVIPYIMLAIVFVGYVIIFEKFILLQFVYRVNFEKFNSTIKKMLAANDFERARSYTRSVSKTALPLLVLKAVDAYESDPMKVRAVVSEESLRFFPRIRRHLSQLPNLATACVMLGAVAAVHGIWSSFQMAGELELGIKSLAFSSGLSHALLPLSLSLVVAILLMVPFGILDAIALRLETEMEHSLCLVLNILSPEIQPVFAESGLSSDNLAESSLEGESDHDPYAAREGINFAMHGVEEGVGHEEIVPKTSRKRDTIPDEEEIL